MTLESLDVDVAGKRTALVRGGDGPPVVFLHSAFGEAWWSEWCEELARTHSILLPAHPGFGASEGIEDVDDVEDLAFHYDDLLTTLGVERPALVGQSLGGWIAAEYAVRWPERLSALVLVDAVGLRLDDAPVPDMWAHRPPELADMLFADPDQPLAQLMRSFQPDHPPSAEVAVPFLKAMQATARLGWNPYLHDPRLERRLGRVTCPTLVVWGERDGLVPIAHGRRYAERIEGARLETIPDCGHLPTIERPRELGELLGRFLGGVVVGGADVGRV